MSWLSRLEVGEPVYATDGLLGTIVSVPRVDLGDPSAPAEVIVLASQENAGPGVEEFRRVIRPMIERIDAGQVYLNVPRGDVPRASAAVSDAHRRLRAGTDHLRVPLAEEQVEVSTSVREMGYVEVRKKVEEYLDERDVPLRYQEVHVDRVPRDEIVSEYLAPYMDGDTYVVPVIEEEVVVTTRLRLKEELRIRRSTTEQHKTIQTPYLRERLMMREHWYDTAADGDAAEDEYIDSLAGARPDTDPKTIAFDVQDGVADRR